ncbi:hypothetical protein AB0D78_21060 [Streptomyces avermitilis]|uniref:hypothetical protein n=1 Tax=Streptomyces avermitilis TaxID=33903 RepID=UPI0033DF8020
MAKSTIARATTPDTVWLARGRHVGPAPEEVVRRRLRRLKSSAVIQDHLELDDSADGADRHVFEARWQVADAVTVRARLNLDTSPGTDGDREWVLVAEAERPWELDWPSPATMFWPDEADVPWDHDLVPGLRFRDINPLPTEDKALRRALKAATRHTWSIHVVVHEAMTPDAHGRLPLAPLMPAGLRHRIVEHRAAPDQFQIVNWALDDLGVQVPRGGAVVLPGTPPRPGYEDGDFTVRSVFLDGSRPSELIDTVTRFAALPRPLPDQAEEAVSDLRRQWHLLTVEEELAKARDLVAKYAEALDAMTKSRDLYREAARLAHEALTAAQQMPGAVPSAREPSRRREGFPLRSLVKPLERVRETAKTLRATSIAGSGRAPDDTSGSASRPATGEAEARKQE